ncbi:uncharacterized protein LOC128893991 isoform X1 [Hylaeus anthracinus]|uniref:uncharacterized protein LOC128893991 isoform X1 n=2 Tax=Hylaeus anthracinus TaxID=313031 RepID=UPI0023B9BF54|nr:uncharacterized protein LOC128893991 isoform X1 [Hylaeus anthracinus]
MPGIYVRETSWIDWIQQRENPVLTVPSSYWLCYKKNIYKFILRYHRTALNLTQFPYGKELMKIIRRIIKNQPRQGQQFSTSNLLVTYNHTSWTRQDKMFALMKFKERSVSAFSHAFVLTIKIMLPLESIEQTSKNNRLNTSSKIDNFTKTSSNKQTSCVQSNKLINSPKASLEPSVPHNDLSETKTKANKCLKNSIVILQNINKNQSRSGTSSKLPNSTANKVDENKIAADRLEESNCSVDENMQDKTVGNNNITASNINKISEDSNTVDATNIDSINLPYQYLIEREIEDAKRKMLDDEVSSNETKKRKIKEIDEHSTNSVKSLTDIAQSEEIHCQKKRKHLIENIQSRSSDITDLVMEGLMFTIRQEQDAVAVIEQKTKLEIDEVLENSEKIETKEGEKCLRNSSLLGLENLITMIELPKKMENKYKSPNIITPESKNMQMQTSSSVINDDKKDNVANNSSYLEMYEYKCNENMNITENDDAEYEEEEDIIPEALQDDIFRPSLLDYEEIDRTKDKLEVMIDKDLLMDDIDTDELIKSEITTEHNSPCRKDLVSKINVKTSCSNNSLDVNHTSTFNNAKRLNVPVVISNEIITVDQIPRSLQKILKKQSPIKNNEKEMDEDCTNVHKMQSYEEKDSASKIESSGHSSNQMFQNTLNLNNSETLVHTDETHENKLKLKKEKSPEQITNTSKAEQLSSNEIEDITDEFYQELLLVQKKKNLPNQRYLRPRRKSLNMLSNTNLGDTHIEIMKFFHDITRGAKVVVKRMSTKSIHSIIEKSSSLATCMQ